MPASPSFTSILFLASIEMARFNEIFLSVNMLLPGSNLSILK